MVSLFSAVASAPLDVYDPPVLIPNASTVWTVGVVTNITWDVSNPPKDITNPIGMVFLAQGAFDSSISGPGGYDDPLASGFSIHIGSVQITVPDINAGTYKVVVMGDSGNASRNFTITA